jgi:hypothetical protein
MSTCENKNIIHGLKIKTVDYSKPRRRRKK